MAEYIDKEYALSHPFANGQYDHEHANEHFIFGYESYKEWLEQIPAADVVEVVRCKDCRYYNIYQLKRDYTDDRRYSPSVCIIGKYAVRRNPEWFCADGERRQDNATD